MKNLIHSINIRKIFSPVNKFDDANGCVFVLSLKEEVLVVLFDDIDSTSSSQLSESEIISRIIGDNPKNSWWFPRDKSLFPSLINTDVDNGELLNIYMGLQLQKFGKKMKNHF